MSELRNCPVCNSLFAYNGASAVCQNCFESEQTNFNKVKHYIYEHPGCDLQELKEATGLKEETLFRFIREGRLIYRRV